MNWIAKFNILEKECIDKILDIIAEYDNYKNDLLDNVYTEVYRAKPIVNDIIERLNANKITQEQLDNSCIEIQGISKIMCEEYERIGPMLNERVKNCVVEIIKIRNATFDTVYAGIRSKKEYTLMKKRADLVSRKIANMTKIFDMAELDETGITYEIQDDLHMIREIAERKNEEYDEKQKAIMDKLKESQKIDYSKIFDYKEMILLAEKNEYTRVRQTGDHIIMQHTETNKIVPIPAHELKYGLMLQIQKQIYANKVN